MGGVLCCGVCALRVEQRSIAADFYPPEEGTQVVPKHVYKAVSLLCSHFSGCKVDLIK